MVDLGMINLFKINGKGKRGNDRCNDCHCRFGRALLAVAACWYVDFPHLLAGLDLTKITEKKNDFVVNARLCSCVVDV